MNPVEPTQRQSDWWINHHKITRANLGVMGGPEEAPDVLPCPVVVGTDIKGQGLVGVVWQLSEIELFQLAEGGTLWLTTFGGLPIHTIEVQPKEQRGEVVSGDSTDVFDRHDGHSEQGD